MAQPAREHRTARWPSSFGELWRSFVQGAWSGAKWPAIAALWLVSLGLGYWGFANYMAKAGEQWSFWDTLYRSLQLFALESGSVEESTAVTWPLQVARLLAPAVMAYTAFQALALVFSEQFQMLCLWCIKKHVVICGLGRKGLLLVKGFRERGFPIVVIEIDEGNDSLEYCKDLGAITLVGDATERDLLRKARVQRARYLVAVCGDDGANAEIAVHAEELVRDRPKGVLACFAHIFDLELCTLLREKEIAMPRGDAFRLEFFNVFESGARALLYAHPPFDPVPDATAEPHLLVLGLGRMGESLVVRVARDWRDLHGADGAHLRITIVDQDAEARVASVCLLHPELERTCRLATQQLDVQSPEFQRAGFLFDDQGRCDVTVAYSCFDGDSASLAAALTVHRRLRERGIKIPIFVRVTEGSGLAKLLAGDGAGGEFDNLHAFRLLDETCRPDLLLRGINEIIARAIHQDYLRTELAKGAELRSRPALVPWDELGEDYRESNRHQAAHITHRLEAFGYHIVPLSDWDAAKFEFSPDEVEQMAEMEHERWCAERERSGWTYGPERDDGRKLHPDLEPWAELDDETREKDRVMVRGLPSFLAKAGFQVQRLPGSHAPEAE